MDRQIAHLKKRLTKKAKRGFRGYPVGTLSCYGPDDRRASKLVAAIVEHEGGEATEMRKWYSEHGDVRNTLEILEESVLDKIIGCPHEEDIDYQGSVCPECPFWANRDRWTGEMVH